MTLHGDPRIRVVFGWWTDALIDFIDRHPRLFVLTGAGCSPDSGIPDYRDAGGEWKRRQPIMYQDFVANERARKRYWARSLAGFRRVRGARPNGAHDSLARLGRRGRVAQLVTQNVDGLHQAAGSRNVIDLHGRIDAVRCLGCEQRSSRDELQLELERGGTRSLPHSMRLKRRTAMPNWRRSRSRRSMCPRVTLRRTREARRRVLRREGSGGAGSASDGGDRVADAMLVVGSSLMVYSGYRFVPAMADAGKPIAAINLGRARSRRPPHAEDHGSLRGALRVLAS